MVNLQSMYIENRLCCSPSGNNGKLVAPLRWVVSGLLQASWMAPESKKNKQ